MLRRRGSCMLVALVASPGSAVAEPPSVPPITTAARALVQIVRVSVTGAGDQPGGESAPPATGPDGQLVAFMFNTSMV